MVICPTAPYRAEARYRSTGEREAPSMALEIGVDIGGTPTRFITNHLGA
jgi:hypothetical protein